MSELTELRTRIMEWTGAEFISQLNSVCMQLHSEFKILLFGFIIFDESTPGFRKLMRDTDYWSALDKTSSDRIMVFSLADRMETKADLFMEMMTSAPRSRKSLTESYSHLLKEVFKDESRLVYPSVLLFQVHNGQIYNYRLVPLRCQNEFESMKAVQDLFECIAEVLAKVTPENFGNHPEIFNLVKNELLERKYTMYILEDPKMMSDFIGRVKTLLFIG